MQGCLTFMVLSIYIRIPSNKNFHNLKMATVHSPM
uniref:Acyl-CoA-binding domain-containing protein 2-like n=1 Tax=Rhizophora mucronata TaxID=61149 RepID=A0A2P2JCC9_RHIMU